MSDIRKTIGVIGGSGLYEMEGLEAVSTEKVDTPFGTPSDEYIVGRLGDAKMVFLPRHGKGHRLSPTEINFRANIYGMKMLGVEWIISVSAVGSMREDIHPGHIVMVDQFFDRTKHRASSFYTGGVVCHVHFADPICSPLAGILYQSGCDVGVTMHKGGTYIVMEGPQFSTRAESRIYRQWGVDVIGMTNLPEAKLAREAEICYATMALATDYDCWHESEEDVTIEAVLEVIRGNVANARKIIALAVERIPESRDCPCANAMANALLTDPAAISQGDRERFSLLLGKYLGEEGP